MRTSRELEREGALEALQRLRLVRPPRDDPHSRLRLVGRLLLGYLDTSGVDLDLMACESAIPLGRLCEIFLSCKAPTTEELTDILGVLGVAPTAFWRQFDLELTRWKIHAVRMEHLSGSDWLE